MSKIKVNRAGVFKLLSNIKENKATGPDGIPGKILKICAEELADVYTLLFQASLDQGVVPEDWKDANIVPLFKKGDKTKAVTYRPVSLPSISCKLLEHIIHSSIMAHLDEFKFLNNAQHGFRKKRSCETQLISTLEDFNNCLNKKQQIDAILLDFSKAFDKVDHEGLLLKLDHCGISDSLLSWIRSFLIGRGQKVLVDGTMSAPRPVLSGVPQGTVLGPLLFLIYINDISDHLSQGTEIRLFADDSLLYRTINSPEDAVTLQKDLDQLQRWEATWKMEFHPQKCQLLRITNKRKFIHSQYNIHNVILEETCSAKYLGVTIDSKLRWKKHYSHIVKKANNVLSFLQRNLNNCPPHIKDKCYKALVRPILEYGSVVWDPHFKTDVLSLEKVQKRAGRFVSGNYKLESGNTKTNMLNLKWKPLEERRAQSKLILFFKAKHGIVEIPVDNLSFNYTSQTRRQGTYAIPTSVVDGHLHSFYPSTIRLWNSLPVGVRTLPNADAFKSHLEKLTIKSAF